MVSICRRCGKEFKHRHRPGHYCSRACLFGDPVARFHESYRVDDSGCWVWKKATVRGYGVLSAGGVRTVGQDRSLAHRYSWTLANGPIPDGLLVLHKCDNPPCVNPAHLFLGTHGDNARDKIAKGRGHRPWQFGDRNPRRILTTADVLDIRRQPQVPRKQLADLYGVSVATITSVRGGRNWKHLLEANA